MPRVVTAVRNSVFFLSKYTQNHAQLELIIQRLSFTSNIGVYYRNQLD